MLSLTITPEFGDAAARHCRMSHKAAFHLAFYSHIAGRIQISVWKGYLLVTLAATLWGLAGTLAKFIMVQDIPALILVEIRVTIAALVLWLILAWKQRNLLRISVRDIPYMLTFGVVGIAGITYSYYYAINHTNVATALLLQYLAPAFIMLFAIVFQGEPFSSSRMFSLLLAFSGCFLMVGGFDLTTFNTNKAGVLAGLASAGFFAFYSLFVEHGLKKYAVWTILVYGFSVASVFWWIFHPPWEIIAADYSLNAWILFVVLAIFSNLLPFGLYLEGVRYLRSTQASITAMLEPVIGGLSAYLFLGETLRPLQLLGGILVLLGILLLQTIRPPSAPPQT